MKCGPVALPCQAWNHCARRLASRGIAGSSNVVAGGAGSTYSDVGLAVSEYRSTPGPDGTPMEA